MPDLQTCKCKNGLTIDVYTQNPEVALQAFEYYEKGGHLPWECPFCLGDIDSLSYERNENEFEDTYTCDECDVLITIITPADIHEYHLVDNSETTYMIEFMFGGEPSTWDDEDPDIEPVEPLTPYDATQCPGCGQKWLITVGEELTSYNCPQCGSHGHQRHFDTE